MERKRERSIIRDNNYKKEKIYENGVFYLLPCCWQLQGKCWQVFRTGWGQVFDENGRPCSGCTDDGGKVLKPEPCTDIDGKFSLPSAKQGRNNCSHLSWYGFTDREGGAGYEGQHAVAGPSAR